MLTTDYRDMHRAPSYSEDLQNALIEGHADSYLDDFGGDVDLYGFLKGDYMPTDAVAELVSDAMSAFSANDQKPLFDDIAQQIANGKVPTVTIYRAVPNFVTDINDGDWITLSKKYAQEHGGHRFEGDSEIKGWHILEKEVPVTQIWWDQGSPYELGYSSKELGRENT